MTFIKGQSGNPGGRPKGANEARLLAQVHTKRAIEVLAELMEHSEKDNVRVAAAEVLIDRAWGRPAQEIDIAHSGQVQIDSQAFTPEEARKYLREHGLL